jgi:hypothetical protein
MDVTPCDAVCDVLGPLLYEWRYAPQNCVLLRAATATHAQLQSTSRAETTRSTFARRLVRLLALLDGCSACFLSSAFVQRMLRLRAVALVDACAAKEEDMAPALALAHKVVAAYHAAFRRFPDGHVVLVTSPLTGASWFQPLDGAYTPRASCVIYRYVLAVMENALEAGDRGHIWRVAHLVHDTYAAMPRTSPENQGSAWDGFMAARAARRAFAQHPQLYENLTGSEDAARARPHSAFAVLSVFLAVHVGGLARKFESDEEDTS